MPDSAEVCVCQILLAKMHKVGLSLDRQLPVVVDHKLAIRSLTKPESILDLTPDDLSRRIFDAQLHELQTGRKEPLQPVRVG
jgi:hypothetical protein